MSLPSLVPRLPGNIGRIEASSSKDHTKAEWEAKKELIRELYIRRNKKLSEVMSIVESRTGFTATEQMYKKRLRIWNIRKSTRRRITPTTDSGHIPTLSPQSIEQQTEQDDADFDKVPMAPNNLESVLTCSQLSSLGPYTGLESVLESVWSWSQKQLETPGLSPDSMSKYLTNLHEPPLQDSRTMFRTFELVFQLWRHGRGDLAGMAARRGFYLLEYVLTDDHPDLIWHILDTIYDLVDEGHMQLLAFFLDHAVNLASQRLPIQHPLLQILQQLRLCDHQTKEGQRFTHHLLRQAWLRNVEILGNHICSCAPRELWLYEQIIWDGRTRLRKNSDLRRRSGSFACALRKLSHSEGGDREHLESAKRRVEALTIEFTQTDVGDTDKAQELTLQLLEHTAGSESDPRVNARFNAYARKMLARMHEDRRDLDLAEQNLKWAINKRETAHGSPNDLRVVRDMWVLARHYQKIGRQMEADEVTRDAISRATQYLEDVLC